MWAGYGIKGIHVRLRNHHLTTIGGSTRRLVIARQIAKSVKSFRVNAVFLRGCDGPAFGSVLEVRIVDVVQVVLEAQFIRQQVSLAFNGVMSKQPASPTDILLLGVAALVPLQTIQAEKRRIVGHRIHVHVHVNLEIDRGGDVEPFHRAAHVSQGNGQMAVHARQRPLPGIHVVAIPNHIDIDAVFFGTRQGIPFLDDDTVVPDYSVEEGFALRLFDPGLTELVGIEPFSFEDRVLVDPIYRFGPLRELFVVGRTREFVDNDPGRQGISHTGMAAQYCSAWSISAVVFSFNPGTPP